MDSNTRKIERAARWFKDNRAVIEPPVIKTISERFEISKADAARAISLAAVLTVLSRTGGRADG